MGWGEDIQHPTPNKDIVSFLLGCCSFIPEKIIRKNTSIRFQLTLSKKYQNISLQIIYIQ